MSSLIDLNFHSVTVFIPFLLLFTSVPQITTYKRLTGFGRGSLSGYCFTHCPITMDSSIEEIYEWIDEIGDKIPFSRAKKNFGRDFSDGVLVAELLKYFYPRIVELHNYPPANSYALKIENWNTMNRKVLPKLKLHLSNNLIEELSKANPRAVERLLAEIRKKIQATVTAENKESQETLTPEFLDEIVKVPVCAGDEGEKVYKKMIPATLLERKVAEVKEKDKTIALLEKKIQHLESLLSLKEARIHDLTTQLYKPERNELSFKSAKRPTQFHTSF